MDAAPEEASGAAGGWSPAKPRLRPLRLIVSWAFAAVAVYVASDLVPGFTIDHTGGAFLVAAFLAVINAFVPPVIAALRLPFTLFLGFVLVLLVNAGAVLLVGELFPEVVTVGTFGDALLASIVLASVSMVISVLTGTNDDDEYTLRVVQRIARRQGGGTAESTAGIIFLEIDGLALPILRDAMRDGSAPNLARWIAEDGYRLSEWETDLSSQTGASQAGILLGSNHDIPAFRWVEKETQTVVACSAIRRRRWYCPLLGSVGLAGQRPMSPIVEQRRSRWKQFLTLTVGNGETGSNSLDGFG